MWAAPLFTLFKSGNDYGLCPDVTKLCKWQFWTTTDILSLLVLVKAVAGRNHEKRWIWGCSRPPAALPLRAYKLHRSEKHKLTNTQILSDLSIVNYHLLPWQIYLHNQQAMTYLEGTENEVSGLSCVNSPLHWNDSVMLPPNFPVIDEGSLM